jgi:hypothetical protein
LFAQRDPRNPFLRNDHCADVDIYELFSLSSEGSSHVGGETLPPKPR